MIKATRVYDELKKAQPIPLTEDDSKIMMTLIMSSRDQTFNELDEEKDAEFIKDFKATMPWSAFTARPEAFGLGIEITIPVALVTAQMTDGSPGEMVLYLAFYYGWCLENNVKRLDMNTLCSRVIPMGKFDKDSLENAWVLQKNLSKEKKGTDNWLDYPEAWHEEKGE